MNLVSVSAKKRKFSGFAFQEEYSQRKEKNRNSD